MDPKHDGGRMLLAPGAHANSSSLSFPSADRRATSQFPPVDEHLVQPEVSRDEIILGRKIVTMGANPPHADANTQLDFVIVPHVRPGYRASTDLLTRVSESSNFATDLSVRKEGIDPETGSRYLEELSFEIVNEQSLRIPTDKARELMKRGVRRVFGIFVKTGELREWSKTEDKFIALPKDGFLEDRLFIRPIAIKALVDEAVARAEVIRALDKQQHPEIVKIEQRGEDKGFQKGLDEGLERNRNMLVRWVRSRFGELSAGIHARIRAADAQTLDAWADKLERASSIDDVFG